MKKFSGTVLSNKMKDTIVVAVSGYEKHPKYGKFIKKRKKFKVHDEGNKAQAGDRVTIVETRPMSKEKHFKLL